MDPIADILPYSTANTKGQCIRHPSIQLKQKKTFGSGYKTITSICPMCAMELMSIEGNDNDDDCGGRDVGHVENEVVSSSTSVGWDASSIHASAQRSNSSTRTTQQQQHHRSSRSRYSKHRSDDVSIKSAPSTYNREPHRQQQHRTNIESTSSFGHSSRSCGSHHHHHRPTTTFNINKQYYSHEISSCDSSTLDMSLSVSSRSLSSRSSSSQGGESSRRSNASSSSAASYTSSHSGQSRRSNNNIHRPKQQEQEYVCGLQYNNGYYTGQIDIDTNLPHGLGSLRDRQGVICNEGQWHYGRLVESSLSSPSLSTSNTSYAPRQQHAYTQQQQQEKKTTNFEQYIVNSSNEEDESSSACSTVHTDDNDDSSIPSVALSSQSSSSTYSSWSGSSRHSSSSSSTTRRLHSPSSPKYSARESKNTTLSLVPQDKFRSSSRTVQARTSPSVATKVSVPQAATGNQVAYNKLQEYQNYIDMCDDNEDWHLKNHQEKEVEEYGGRTVGSRRVRFREDP